MYFKSRAEAGKKLAEQIVPKYKGQPCAVVGLSDGGIMVGAQIALQLQSVLNLLLTESIEIPREGAVAGIAQGGAFTYNQSYSPGEIEEFISEFYHTIEQQKREKMHEMDRKAGRHPLIRKELLKDKNIFLVSDGLVDGFSLDIAMEFLKPIDYKRLIIATPLASVPAVDRMHVLADEIFCLSVIENYMDTDHYYDIQDIPPHELVIKTVHDILKGWID